MTDVPTGETKVAVSSMNPKSSAFVPLHREGDKTRVRLVHRGLPADAVEDHGRGWAHYLERLSIAAAGGDTGPDIDGPS